MKKLNLRIPKSYEAIRSEISQFRKKYFLIAEEPTGESYFEGIKNNRRSFDIAGDIHIEIVPKAEGEETLSHPKQLVSAALEFMGRVDNDGNDIPQSEWEICSKWDYDKEQDRVCIVFDRDYKDLEWHLKWIYEKCRENNIFIGMSNPNFELWLLMHFPDIGQYDSEELFQNKKNLRHQVDENTSRKKKYLEILVSKAAGGYSKGSKIKFERFKKGVFLAMEQEKMFEENIDLIKEKMGTNLGLLLKEMQDR